MVSILTSIAEGARFGSTSIGKGGVAVTDRLPESDTLADDNGVSRSMGTGVGAAVIDAGSTIGIRLVATVVPNTGSAIGTTLGATGPPDMGGENAVA